MPNYIGITKAVHEKKTDCLLIQDVTDQRLNICRNLKIIHRLSHNYVLGLSDDLKI